MAVTFQVGTKIATIKVQDLSKGSRVNFALENERDYQNIGAAAVSSHNWSKYFKITRKANGDGVIRLKQSLHNVFKVGIIKHILLVFPVILLN